MLVLISKILIFVITALLFAVVVKQGASDDNGFQVASYKLVPKILAITFMFLMSWVVYSASTAQDVKLFVVCIFWFFYLGAIIFLLEVYINKIWFDSETIHWRYLLRKKGAMKIDEIQSLKKESYGFRITDVDGEKLNLPYLMSGVSELHDVVQASLASSSKKQ